MVRRKPTDEVTVAEVATREVQRFSVPSLWLRKSPELRLDARHFNPALAHALEVLRRSGMKLARLGDVTQRVFIPPRFKRIYVERSHGVPFLQGGHIVHFRPSDLKYLSTKAHARLERWIIQSGWILVTCSGTVGRVSIAPPEWDGWAASQHILRIVPDENACPSGYLYSFLASSLGHAQLTAQIYGAVVDELTEDQAKAVLVPLPVTRKQELAVQEIDHGMKASVAMRSKAVTSFTTAEAQLATLIGSEQPEIPTGSQAASRPEPDMSHGSRKS